MKADNMAAMREALEKLDKWLFIGVDGYVHGQPDKTDEIERTIKDALSEPGRNCDVGTAEEQREKFLKFCAVQNCDVKCPMGKSKDMFECVLKWAQMPYTEGGEK